MSGSFIDRKDVEDFVDQIDNDKSSSGGKAIDNLTPTSRLSNNKPAHESESSIGEEPYRYIVVVVYFLLSFSNGLQWVCISAIADNFAKAFSLNSFEVELFSLLYMFIFPFAFPVAAYLIDEVSIRLGVSSFNQANSISKS